MQVQALNIPGAVDSDIRNINPRRELESCNHLLDNPAAIKRFYDENGYLLARDVLNKKSVEQARDLMLAVAAKEGLIKPGDINAVWTGKPPVTGLEEDACFHGVSTAIFAREDNLKVLGKLLGETPCFVPLVQHRIYPPSGQVTLVHQDGFYSAGIPDYRPVWITLTTCQREVGGLMIAVGQNNRGYLHNLAKPAPYPIPADAIPLDSWATTDYYPGDVLIVHPYAPHASMPNTSNRLRVSFDTRVQASAHPTAFAGNAVTVTPNSITMDIPQLGRRTFRVDSSSFVRVRDPGTSEPFEQFTNNVKPGMRLMIVIDGDRAQTLRKAAEA